MGELNSLTLSRVVGHGGKFYKVCGPLPPSTLEGDWSSDEPAWVSPEAEPLALLLAE